MLTPFATYVDVEARWRTLTDDEITQVTNHIADAAVLIRAQVPNVDARIAAGSLDIGLARLATVRAVLRVMLNPTGLKSETDGEYSYTRDSSQASGELYISSGDLALLSPRGRAQVGTIRVREPQWLRQTGRRRD